jgi:hypothetical protein
MIAVARQRLAKRGEIPNTWFQCYALLHLLYSRLTGARPPQKESVVLIVRRHIRAPKCTSLVKEFCCFDHVIIDAHLKLCTPHVEITNAGPPTVVIEDVL